MQLVAEVLHFFIVYFVKSLLYVKDFCRNLGVLRPVVFEHHRPVAFYLFTQLPSFDQVHHSEIGIFQSLVLDLKHSRYSTDLLQKLLKFVTMQNLDFVIGGVQVLNFEK